MKVGSLFAGIGGIELGLERAGMQVVWQVEKDDYCRRVLAKHWPGVERYEDVRDISAADLDPVDLVCGGFPCQDISTAGKGEGIEGERSGLWSEMRRIIRNLRPRLVLVENVAALLANGMGKVLGDLAESGYDAEWTVLSACDLGARHRRARVFVLAYPDGSYGEPGFRYLRESDPTLQVGHEKQVSGPYGGAWMEDPSALYRTPDGVPARVDRLRGLGNAVVPQVAEWIGRRVLQTELGE